MTPQVQVIDCLTFSDGELGRRDTLTSTVLPVARIWSDGHQDTSHTKHQQTPVFVQTVQDLRSMCPAHQLKKRFFDILRDRVAQLYSQRQKRSTQRKNLQQFTDQFANNIVGGAVSGPADIADPNLKNDVRINEWAQVGVHNPRVLALVKELPAVHTPRLIIMMTQRRADWVEALAHLTPKDMLALQEHLPAHLAALHSDQSGVEMLREIIAQDASSLSTRDCHGRSPLHMACMNEDEKAEESVATILEHAPESAFTQDHSGMLPIHHACLNSGPAAGSIAGRLISVFSPGTQVADQRRV